MKRLNIHNAYKYTLILIIITLLIRIIIAWKTGLGIGEAYYFRGAKDIALSYFDQPPLFLWLSGLSIRLFCLSNFALRLPAVLLFAGTSWLLYIIGKRLFNPIAGFYAVLIMNISFVFTIPVASWFQPDAPLMFFWLLCTYCIIQIMFPGKEIDVKTNRKSRKVFIWWVLVGISLGLTTLSKYHAPFLIAGVLIFILFSKDHKHWLWHPGPYIALLINLIIALPIFIWNYENDWASFIFQGSRAGSGGEFKIHFDWFLRSIFGQALWLAPWIWFPLIRQLFISYRKRKKNPVFSFFFWTAILPIVFFTIVTLWSDTGYHFHWQAPGYMMLFIPLGAFINERLNAQGKKKRKARRWLISSAIFTILFSVVLICHMITGFWSSYGPKDIVLKFGGKYDPTIEGTDYNAIKTRFEEKGWMKQKNLFVGSIRWWQAGKIDWALKGEKEMICFHRDPRNYAFFSDPKKLLGYDAIVIAQYNENAVNTFVNPFFEKVKQLEDIQIIRNDVVELELQVYYCSDFQIPQAAMNDVPVYRQLTGKHLKNRY